VSRLLTTAQAAARLGVDNSQVRRYIAAGRLAAQKPGRDWMIDEDDLARFGRPAMGRPKSYITLDEHNQLATGPDWPELEADGHARLQAEIDRQKAEADAVREWDRTHDGITGEELE